VSTTPQQGDTNINKKLDEKLPVPESRKSLKDGNSTPNNYFQPLGYSQPPFNLSLNKSKPKTEDT